MVLGRWPLLRPPASLYAAPKRVACSRLETLAAGLVETDMLSALPPVVLVLIDIDSGAT